MSARSRVAPGSLAAPRPSAGSARWRRARAGLGAPAPGSRAAAPASLAPAPAAADAPVAAAARTAAARARVRALPAVALALFAAACGGVPLAPAVVDYHAGVRVIEIGDLADVRRAAPAADATIVYNLDHEEGRKAALRASAQGQEPPLAYTVAHNVARRLREAEPAFAARGLAPPVVRVSTRKNPRGWIATGDAYGDAFVAADPGALEGAPTVRVSGGLAERGGAWEARLALAGPGPASGSAAGALPAGRVQEHVFAYLSPAQAARAGLGDWPEDPRAQLIARFADLLAPHALAIEPRGAPIAFVREVGEGGALVCDLGLERRTLHVEGFLETFDPPLPAEPSRADLELLLRHRFVRVQLAGGPAPPEHPTWLRVRVREAE